MLKFFRKYNKHLLAVFMSLLMIVFIGGTALERFLTPNVNPVVARSRLGDIGRLDQAQATELTGYLQNLRVVDWQRPVPQVSKPIDLVDWILLSREAQQLGTELSSASAKAWLGGEDGMKRVRETSRAMRARVDGFLDAISQWRSIVLAAQAVAGAAVPSAAEVRAAAREVLDKVKVQAVLLPAKAFVDPRQEFTDAEIEAQWQPYRDVKRGPGLQFGYFLPPRVRVQFLMIDHAKLLAQIGVANLEKKARKYYDEHRAEFPNPSPPPAAEGAPPPSPYLSWEEAREQAMEAVKGQQAAEAAARIADWIVQFTGEAFHDVERGQDGYKAAPAAVALDSYYEKVVEQIPPSINFPGAVVVGVTGLFREEEAEKVPRLGGAMYKPPTGAEVDFKTLAFRNQGVVPTLSKELGAAQGDYLALFETCRYPLTDDDGNVYVFRVTKIGDGRPSQFASEARKEVVDDLRLLRALEEAKARAANLKDCAAAGGLKQAFDGDLDLAARKAGAEGSEIAFADVPPTPRLQLSQLVAAPGQRTTTVSPEVGAIPAELIADWFALEEADDKFIIQELKDRAAVLVVEWKETVRGNTDEFEKIQSQIASLLRTRYEGELLGDWMDPDKIRARNGFDLAQK
ncbi:MAG: hypothetical protein HY763_03770 [Planctomycetes bacterium]|nr:hypothetical protein [Planctomycetota bacterium]